jgi:hypothetical protein
VTAAVRNATFPMSPRLDPLKAALAKLDPQKPVPREPLPMITAKPMKGKRGLKNR